jgi:hypothetical protein
MNDAITVDAGEVQGCPGFVLISGRTLGLCIACGRHGVRNTQPQLRPAASLGPGGVWDCVDRMPAVHNGVEWRGR